MPLAELIYTTPEALEKIIVGLQEKGYRSVPVSQLIYTGDRVDQMIRQIEKYILGEQ